MIVLMLFLIWLASSGLAVLFFKGAKIHDVPEHDCSICNSGGGRHLPTQRTT